MSRQSEFFDAVFAHDKVMAIIRGLGAEASVERAIWAWEAGIGLVEIPIESAGQTAALAAVVEEGHARGKYVGAGSVYTPEQVDVCVRIGVDFAVSPGFVADVCERCAGHGLAHLPAVATPTEVISALRAGSRWVKVFPASVLGPAWFKAIKGPFPDLHMVATGGVDATNLSAFLHSGAAAVGIGSGLASRPDAQALVAACEAEHG